MSWVGPWHWAVLTLLGGQLAEGYDEAGKLEAARLYGNVGGYAYYFVDLLVGSPRPQRASVIVDTGSAVCAFPCRGCAHCGRHQDALFDVSRSVTATWIPCGPRNNCGRCVNRRCSYSQSYTEGSSISGSWFYDYVSLGDEFQRNPPVKGRLGCHSRETKLFYTQKANGIFGMAPGQTGKPTILEDLFQDKQHIDKAVFSMCLAEEGGLLTVGGYNSSIHLPGDILWLPLVVRSYYAIQLSQVAIEGGGVVLDGGFGQTIVDSGTTYTYLPNSLYRKLDAEVRGYCSKNRDCGGRPLGGACWLMQPREPADALSGFPTLRITFDGGGRMLWRPQSYLYRRDGKGNAWCYGFQDNGLVHETVLGATWMLHRDVIFDLTRRRLGLAEARCPDFQKRPPAPSGRSTLFTLAGFAEQPATSMTGGRPGLFTSLLVLAVGGGLWVILSNLRLAGQRAAQDIGGVGEKGMARRPQLPSLQAKQHLAISPSSASPTFFGRSRNESLEDDSELNEGVCSTPIEVWLRPAPSSGSGGGTPGSAGGQRIGSSSDGGVEDTLRLIS
mmetsp:Transcript_8130/g.22067  ORF Transcript_8130/g.22067 Transcript_8130/m.22067 type:complete len:555 (-) Transcript_8130:128-1792(-)